MPQRKKSFFERLTGSVNEAAHQTKERGFDDYEEFNDEFSDELSNTHHDDWEADNEYAESSEEFADDEGELAVDIYETPDHIVVQAMVAGVRPDALDVSITREKCIIKGRREAPGEASPDEYLHKELYWGAFSRSVLLPEEIEVEESNASEDHGLLTIMMPKINKHNETKLEIQSE